MPPENETSMYTCIHIYVTYSDIIHMYIAMYAVQREHFENFSISILYACINCELYVWNHSIIYMHIFHFLSIFAPSRAIIIIIIIFFLLHFYSDTLYKFSCLALVYFGSCYKSGLTHFFSFFSHLLWW